MGWTAGAVVPGIAIAWLLGACALLLQPELPGPAAIGLAWAACVLLAAVTRHAAPVAFALGLTLAWHQCTVRMGERLDPALEGQTLHVVGVVASVPQVVGSGQRFRLATQPQSGVPPLIELTWYEPQWVPRGAERLQLEVRLRRPRGFSNPGGTDYDARLLRDGIGATGYVRAATRLGHPARDVARYPVLVARDVIARAIRSSLGERPATGIVAGLAVGLQDALTRDQWLELSRSGTSHLMAISGMHVGLFAIVAGWIAARLQRVRQRRGARGAARDAAVVTGTIAALGYGALAGWSVPTQRTAIMIAIVAAALWSRRRVGSFDALALGAMAVLALEPLAPLAPGFWLSFVAVAAILLVADSRRVQRSRIATFARVQWAVTLGLVPVLAGSFGSVSLVSVGVNLLAIPLYTLVLVPAVLAGTALLIAIPVLGTTALGAVAWLIEATWPLIAVPAAWQWAAWGVAGLGPVAWCVLIAGAAASIAPLPAPGRIAGLLLVVAACAWRPAPPDEGAVHFALLDVGQGLAAVIETRRHVLIYDTGPRFRSGGDAGAMVVVPYLRHRGLRRVDLLVASHDDLDHAGGASSIARFVPVAERAASGHALDSLGAVERCRRGERWLWDGVSFEWLHPGVELRNGDNDRSCVLRVRAGPHTLLLTGDVERAAELELVEAGHLRRVDVLTVPHHGSRTSSMPEFVSATQPRWALVAAGHRNRWGFPKADVAARWQDAGAEVVVSSATGAIEFDLDPGRPLAPPRLWRPFQRRLWHDL